jgi:epoxyqueuosine reductase QueG
VKSTSNFGVYYDQPVDFGVDELCDACRKCARECPATAITTTSKTNEALGEAGNSGYLRWVIDHKKSFQYWSECGTNCNLCIFVCSYNRGYKWTNSMFKSSKANNTLIDSLLETLDEHELDFFNKKTDNYWLID